jgi:hypothetical protein
VYRQGAIPVAPATPAPLIPVARVTGEAARHRSQAMLDLCLISAVARRYGQSQNMPISRHFVNGANRDRTGDLLLAKQALSQLSYGP